MKLLSLSSVVVIVAFATGCETSRYEPPPVSGYPPVQPAPGPRPPSPAAHRVPEPWVDVSISIPERQIIQGYVAGYIVQEKHPGKGRKPKKLPPGLQKKLERGGSLPPGWERKFQKGEFIPIEVYEHCNSLPHEVVVKLPPPPPGTVLITIGGKVARVLAATREILDVFEVEY